jgi:DNA-binding GntR family transcriptional regulator
MQRWLEERLLALVDAAGGRLETSERKLADRLACSPAGARKAIAALVRAGKLRTRAGADGTLLIRLAS